jgi:hypothetical protein
LITDPQSQTGARPVQYIKPLGVSKVSFYIGLILLIAWVAQAAVPIRWLWLENLQKVELYKQLTGLLMMAYLGHQWHLPVLRLLNRSKAAKDNYERHKILGALAPLVFYIHSTQIGYAFTALLATVYLGNVAIGLFNPETVRIKKNWFTQSWMVVHVALSLVTIVLVLYHIIVTLAYR